MSNYSLESKCAKQELFNEIFGFEYSSLMEEYSKAVQRSTTAERQLFL